MSALGRKLLRDLGRMGGAVFTISLVVAAGVAAFATLRGTYTSLVTARDRYYSQQRFGDVFLELGRAPADLVARLEALPEVSRVYARVTGAARVPLAGMSEPAQARVISLPDDGVPPLNGIRLVAGRLPNNDRDDEALLSEQFAETQRVKPGDVLKLVMQGRERYLRIVGTAMSPEYVLAVSNGASASPERFAVFWMPRRALEAVFDQRASFNSLVLKLAPRTSALALVRKLDSMFEQYGGLGAYARARQMSNYLLTQDLGQLGTFAAIVPIIFLGVAAFLLNVVLSRMIDLDRPQIATLKALGYTNLEVGRHYLEFALTVSLLGALVGLAASSQLGAKMTGFYVPFYRLPGLAFQTDRSLITAALCVSLGAGFAGSIASVRRVMRLPPAEAMRPALPPRYGQGVLGKLITRRLSSAARMVARELTRRPLSTALSALGIGAATGIIVVGQHFSDSMNYIVDDYLQALQRETISVEFAHPLPSSALSSLGAIQGVRDVQWQSVLQVRLRAGHRERIVPLVAHGTRHSLRPLLDAKGRERTLQPGEVLITDMLAKVLALKPGDEVTAETLQGERIARPLRITGTISELVSLWVHMHESTFERWLDAAPMATTAQLAVDADRIDAVQAALLDMPEIASATRTSLIIDDFRRQQGQTVRTFTRALTLFAVIIAIAVVYNNARVALSMRARELASLRVLGFERGEISALLLGELAAQVLLGTPLGLRMGVGLIDLMISVSDPESFRFPRHVSSHAFAFAALVTVLAAMGSAFLVRRKLNQLDLIEVLKTRE